MDTQIIVIALNLAVIPSCSFFVGLWIKRIEATLTKLQDTKASNDMVNQHVIQSGMFRAEMISTQQDAREEGAAFSEDIVKQFRTHGHIIDCPNCKATAGSVVLK